MNVSGIVDIVITLTVIYLALSVVVSQINEAIAAFLGLRGKALYAGVFKLLGQSTAFTAAVMNHPLCASSKSGRQSQPSYINARNFSIALWQSVAISTPKPNETIDQVSVDVASIATPPATNVADLQQAVTNLPVSSLRTQLYGLLSAAANDYEKLLAATDAWFNHQMDRVSGWYRRQTQWIVLVISAILVVMLGVDTVRIATRLTGDSAVRQAFAARISQALPSPPSAQSAATPLTPEDQRNVLSALDDASFLPAFVEAPWENHWSVSHCIGLIVTFLAITLGAPFWFDVLQQIANMRFTGPKPGT